MRAIPRFPRVPAEPPEPLPLTAFEAAVFRALQEDGRVPFTAVAQSLGVSEANVRRTVKHLIAKDVFTITAVADPRLMGLESMSWLALAVQLSELEHTATALAAMPEIDYVVITTGAWHVMAEVACRGTEELVRSGQARSRPARGSATEAIRTSSSCASSSAGRTAATRPYRPRRAAFAARRQSSTRWTGC